MMMPCSLSTDDQLVVQRLEQQLKERGHLEELNFEQLVQCMHNNPAYFLHRYGAFLSETERQRLFGKLAEKDWMVRTELWRLRKQRLVFRFEKTNCLYINLLMKRRAFAESSREK